MKYKISSRIGPRTEKSSHESLDAALTDLEARAREVAKTVRRPKVEMVRRTYEPGEQIAARIELKGPRGLRAGVDVHGDGHMTVYTGSIRRDVIEPAKKEDPIVALRKALEP